MSGIWLIGFVVLWALVLIQCFLTIAILRQIGLLSARLPEPKPQGLPLGTRAPDFTLQNVDGQRVSLTNLLGRELLLAFISPRCPACESLVPALNTFLETRLNSNMGVYAICSAGEEDCRRYVAERQLAATVLIDPSSSVLETYSAPGVPYTVYISADGTIRRHGIARNIAELERVSGDTAVPVQQGQLVSPDKPIAPVVVAS